MVSVQHRIICPDKGLNGPLILLTQAFSIQSCPHLFTHLLSMTSLQTAATSYNRALLKFFPYSFITAIKNVSLKHKSVHSIEVMPHQGSSNKAAKALQGWQQQKTRNISIATFSLLQSQAAIHSWFRIVPRTPTQQAAVHKGFQALYEEI